MYDYREYLLTIAAIFLSLTLGIFIGASFGEDYLVSNQREIIALMELEIGRLKERLKEKELELSRWSQVEPLLRRPYREALTGRSIMVLPQEAKGAGRLQRLLEQAGAAVTVHSLPKGKTAETCPGRLAEILTGGEKAAPKGASPELPEGAEPEPPDLFILLLEREPAEIQDRLMALWPELLQRGAKVVAVFPWDGEAPLPLPADHGDLCFVDNIDTLFGELALLELAVSGASGSFGFGKERDGLIPALSD